MGAALVPAVIVVALALVLVASVVALTRRQRSRVDDAERPDAETLRYRVPEGQDPVAVVAALRRAGHDAVADGDLVLVAADEGRDVDREAVRGCIQGAGLNVTDDTTPGNAVRFVDE